jgi:PAS domain S-box-containing protein
MKFWKGGIVHFKVGGRWFLILAAGCVLAIAAAAAWKRAQQAEIKSRTYKIGWEHDPPFQVRNANGEPTGLAIELVREAAKRRDIKLEWVQCALSSEPSLDSKAVDLWPLVTITPERLKKFHISEGYLEVNRCLVVLAKSPYLRPEDIADGKVSLFDLPINSLQAHRALRDAKLVLRHSIEESLADLCTKKADAAFLEEYTAITALLNGGGCQKQQLRLIPITGPRPQLGIGATFESSDAADLIREEISTLALEGKLSEILTRWSYMSSHRLELVSALLDAQRTERWLQWILIVLASLFLLTFWQAIRIRRERNRAEEAETALRENEKRFMELLQTLQMAAVTIDREGNFTFCNDFLLRQTLWERSQIMGRPVWDFMAPDQKPAGADKIRDSIKKGIPHMFFDTAMLTRDGKRRLMEWNTTLLLDPEGSVTGMAILGVDVTDHRNLREQYLQAQKLESIGRLAGGVAHDFNNILTVINGFAELIHSQLDSANPLRHEVEQILNAGTRAAELTQQLLAFSRKQVVQPKIMNINGAVSGSEKIFRRLVGEDVSLTTKLSPETAMILADPGQVNQILMNLLVNARDAMPHGGRLSIETSNVEIDSRQPIEHSEMVPGSYVLLAVKDSGKGMDEETKSRIFEPFFTTKKMGVGTGLGLATVYGIVRQSKGHILVESEPGLGSTFKIFFPRTDQLPEGVEPSGHLSAEYKGSETILVVEDQDEVRLLACTVLQSHGYRVLEAADGTAALAIADKHPGRIHLLLSDIVMPGMNGKELGEILTRRRPDTSILLTSGYTDETLPKRGTGNGEIAYLPKPYTAKAIVEKVRQVLDKKPS